MNQTSVADTLREYLSLLELLDDAYWEASSIQHKDMLYDIISIFSQEVAEINKLSDPLRGQAATRGLRFSGINGKRSHTV